MSTIETIGSEGRLRDPYIPRAIDVAYQSAVEDAWFAAVAKAKRKELQADVSSRRTSGASEGFRSEVCRSQWLGTPLPLNARQQPPDHALPEPLPS